VRLILPDSCDVSHHAHAAGWKIDPEGPSWKDVERILRAGVLSHMARAEKQTRNEMIAEIFKQLRPQRRRPLLAGLEEPTGSPAEKVKSLMFTFNRSAAEVTQAIAGLMRTDQKDGGQCMKGTSPGS